MSFMANPDYSLRFDWRGREKEMNNISPMLTAKDFRIDDVNEFIRPQFQTMREAIELSRMYRYDMDILTAWGLLKIAIYKKASRYHDLSPLIPLFAKANLVSMDSFNFGRTVVLTANYYFSAKKSET